MKKAILLLLFVLIYTNSQAQKDFQGMAVYESKTSMADFKVRMEGNKNINPEMQKMMEERMKKMFEKTFILNFDKSASIYKEEEKLDTPNQGGGGGMRMMFRMPETATYTDLSNQVQYEARSIFEKDFLIVDTLKPNNWKLSEETKTIAKYVCKKATTMITPQQFNMRIGGGGRGRGEGGRNNQDSTAAPAKPKQVELVAWYTESIPVSVGPDNYTGLPGAILELNTDNGANVITATEYAAKYASKELKQPTKGEKMNRAQFQESMQKIMKDMQNGGGMRIRRD